MRTSTPRSSKAKRIVVSGVNFRSAYLEVVATEVVDRNDLRLEIRYRDLGASGPLGQWRQITAPGLVAQTPTLSDGHQYQVQARWRGLFEGVMPWQPVGTVTIVVDATPPGQPSELIPSLSGGNVHLSWRNPTGAFAGLRVYRGVSADLGAAVIVGTTGGVAGQISEYRDETVGAATTYFYWVVAANASGIEGGPVDAGDAGVGEGLADLALDPLGAEADLAEADMSAAGTAREERRLVGAGGAGVGAGFLGMQRRLAFGAAEDILAAFAERDLRIAGLIDDDDDLLLAAEC